MYCNGLLKPNAKLIPPEKTIESCPNHNRKYNGFNGYNGNCIGFNGNYNGFYWYVMDYIGGMLNPIGKMSKTHYKRNFVPVLLEVLLEKGSGL